MDILWLLSRIVINSCELFFISLTFTACFRTQHSFLIGSVPAYSLTSDYTLE